MCYAWGSKIHGGFTKLRFYTANHDIQNLKYTTTKN